MELARAEGVAAEVVEALRPGCERIEVAGSVRRRKAEVKDLEVVYIARMVEVRVDLFTTRPGPATEMVISRLVAEGFWRFDEDVRRNGWKYKRMVHRASGLVVELFRAVEENWGLQLALRTGPAEFNHVLVSHTWEGGVMSGGMEMRGGFLWKLGIRLASREEEEFFEQLGVPWWEPGERSAARLGQWLVEGRELR